MLSNCFDCLPVSAPHHNCEVSNSLHCNDWWEGTCSQWISESQLVHACVEITAKESQLYSISYEGHFYRHIHFNVGLSEKSRPTERPFNWICRRALHQWLATWSYCKIRFKCKSVIILSLLLVLSPPPHCCYCCCLFVCHIASFLQAWGWHDIPGHSWRGIKSAASRKEKCCTKQSIYLARWKDSLPNCTYIWW